MLNKKTEQKEKLYFNGKWEKETNEKVKAKMSKKQNIKNKDITTKNDKIIQFIMKYK